MALTETSISVGTWTKIIMDEAVSVWIARIKNNFQKEFEKKFNKKRKKKKDAAEHFCSTTEIPEVSVYILVQAQPNEFIDFSAIT